MRHTLELWGCCIALFLATGCANSSDEIASGPWSDYTGRYELTPDLVFDVRVEDSRLTLLPSFWRTALVLTGGENDAFASLLHPDFKFHFLRDSSGGVIAVEASGNNQIDGHARRLNENEFLPVELLLAGNGEEALAKLDEGDLDEPDRAVRLGFNLIANFPSRSSAAVSFLSGLENQFPESADLQEALGHAWMLTGRRDKATEHFKNVAKLDPDNQFVHRALRHLLPNDTPAPPDAWTLPFHLDSLFKAPTANEIDHVWRKWQTRSLEASDVEHVAEHSISFDNSLFRVRVLSHTVHGERHYGAVLIPEGATRSCCPVVLDLHGVSADYDPIEVGRSRIPGILQDDLSRTVVVVPAFRGHTLVVGDNSYVSAGTPTDAWDGAADDALAFMNVVFENVAEADTSRTCAYGKSRGGTVALLVGARDSRIDCVVNWAGPASWFANMGTFGWSLREQVEWALWEQWEPGGGWGSSDQFVDWFLREPIARGVPGLAETRFRVLASSPLYFVDRLPATAMHYGVEDRSVPVANAHALQRAVDQRINSTAAIDIHLHAGAGHDMPYPTAHQVSRTFIIDHLFEQ